MADERLLDFPVKASPVPADIIYCGDSADAFNEVQITIQKLIGAYPGLLSIGGLTTVANKMIYTTGANVYATADLTAFGRSLLDDADKAAGRVTLGLPALTNNQVWMGVTSSDPVGASFVAGAGISVSYGANTITIAGTGSGIGWTEVTGTTQAMTADNGYIANNAGLITLTLPATAAVGTAINVLGKGAGGWLIAQNASQQIRIGNAISTAGVGGSVASSHFGDSIELICVTANTLWVSMGAPQGNITVV
jgi:hypothetical protein